MTVYSLCPYLNICYQNAAMIHIFTIHNLLLWYTIEVLKLFSPFKHSLSLNDWSRMFVVAACECPRVRVQSMHSYAYVVSVLRIFSLLLRLGLSSFFPIGHDILVRICGISSRFFCVSLATRPFGIILFFTLKVNQVLSCAKPCLLNFVSIWYSYKYGWTRYLLLL